MTPLLPRGYLMLLALVFGSIFLTVTFAVAGYVLIENKAQVAQTERSKSLAIAEAGIEYYKWHLAHFPNDLENGTGAPGPYTIPYYDPEGAQTGTITLGVAGNSACGTVSSVDLTSTGRATGAGTDATVYARYARPSVALYSYIVNDTVWAGSDRTISGPYHSNGGVRMDGTANANVTSSLASWSCTSTYGCNTTKTVDGVFGAGPNQDLWSFPTPQIDFSAISADFGSVKTTVQGNGGLFFARYSSGNGGVAFNKGYHLVFNGNTVTVYKVGSEYNTPIQAAVDGSNDTSDYTRIKNQTLVGNYTIPVSCPVIYVEDHAWVEGHVSTKVTVIAADTVHTGVAPSIMLPNNLTYDTTDGTSGVTLIAEKNILITPDSPMDMTLEGIFIAQGGVFGRNLYSCPSSYEPRGTLTLHGTTVSYKRTGTKWVDGCGWSGDAGYQTRIDSYDRKLSTSPPPFTPYTSSDFSFVDWRQE